MKFSVLISVYFKENPVFFRAALESIVTQDLLPDEIVLVEDGPISEALAHVIADFKKRYPRLFIVVPLEQNMGLGNALRIGLAACNYEIVARMDTDDICAPNRFRKQIDFLRLHDDIAVVGTNIEEFNNVPGDLGSLRIMPEGGKKLLKFARYRSPVNHPSIMFRKSRVLAAGSYSGDILLWEDFALFIRMLKQGDQFHNIQEILLYFRVGTGIETIKRRSGWHYFKSEWKFSLYALKIKHLSYWEWCSYIILKLPLRLLPPRLVLLIYTRLLRKRNNS